MNDAEPEKQMIMRNTTILELLFKLIYETLADLRHGRRSSYRRMQAAARMLAAALSRCDYTDDPSGARAETERCVEVFRAEWERIAAEGVCSERQRHEAEALVGEIVRLADGMRESEPA